MKYFRVHTADIAYVTKQPRGIFTAVGKLVDAKLLSEDEEKQYWDQRAYFERGLPVPPFYEEGNPDRAITWFKDNQQGHKIWQEMGFYRKMCRKHQVKLYLSECSEMPGEVIYEDEFQIAVKNQREESLITTRPLENDSFVE